MASTWRVLLQFSAVNLTGSGFMSLTNAVNQAHMSTQKLNTALNTLKVAGGVALMDFGKTSLNLFAQMAEAAGSYQQQMVMLTQSMGNKVTPQNLQALATQRFELTSGTKSTIFSMEDITQIQRQLLGAGFLSDEATRKGKSGYALGDAVTFLAEAEKMRKVGPGTPQGTAANLASVMKAYGLYGEAAYDFLNTVSKAEHTTGHFSSTDLRYSEQYFGNLARTIGIKPDDFVVLSAFMSRMGMGPASAGTSLNNLFLPMLNIAKGMTSDNISQKLLAASRLGVLGHVDPAKARAMVIQEADQLKKLGLPYDLDTMTKAQQERLASSAILQTAPNKFLDAYRQHGLEGISNFLTDNIIKYEKEFGKQKGADMYAADFATLLNLRGARGAYILSARDLSPEQQKAFGFTSSLLNFQEQVHTQQDLAQLVSQIRSTLVGQQHKMDAALQNLLLQFGGVDIATGTAIKGGPLDTVLKILTMLNGFLQKIIDFNMAHPQAAAQIGTAIGALGLLATVSGAVLAGAGAIGLARAGLGAGGEAVIAAAVPNLAKSVGSVANFGGVFDGLLLGLFGRPQVRSATGRFVVGGAAKQGLLGAMGDDITWLREGLFGRGVTRDAAGRVTQGAQTAMWGRAGSNIAVDAMVWFKPFLGYFEVFGRLLETLAPRFLGLVGWVTLAIDAVDWFSKHPKSVADIVADIIKVTGVIIVVIKDLVVDLFKWLLDEFVKLVKLLWELFTHPWEVIDWTKTFIDEVRKDLGKKPLFEGGTSPHSVQPAPHLMSSLEYRQFMWNKHHPQPPVVTHQVTTIPLTRQDMMARSRAEALVHPITIHNEINVTGGTTADHKKILEAAHKGTIKALKTALLISPGGTGVPGRPHALAGTA